VTRARKWWLGAGGALGALIIALAVLLAWLLYTAPGLRFALNRGVALTHGQFTYVHARGTLAGTAVLTGLRYHDADGNTLGIQRAALDLQPWALVARRLHVRTARIDGVTLNVAPSRPTSQPGRFSLKPPLAIAIDDMELTRIAISQANKPIFAADRLALAGAWSARRLVVRKFALSAPAGSVKLAGTLALARGYRSDAKATFDWNAHGTRYTGSVTANSDGKTAHLDAKLAGPAPLQLVATFALDTKHAWMLSLDVPMFNARAVSVLPASLHTLGLKLQGAGDARGGKLTGTVNANGYAVLLDPAQFRYDGKTLILDPLRLRSPDVTGNATVTGTVRLNAAPMTATLDVKWQGVQLPADLVGQPLATHGAINITGSTARFALSGDLALGPPDRLADLQIDLAGTPRAIELHALTLTQKSGRLQASGRIGLEPRTTWQLSATARRFDPGALLAGWNGALDFTLASRGTLTPQGPDATLKLERVAGSLRGRSVAGTTADFKVTPTNLLDGSLTLVAGRSRVHASGRPGRRTRATLTLDVASLGDWLPRATGALRGEFSVNGAWPKLSIDGHLQGRKLDAGSRHVDSLQHSASIPDLQQPGGKLDLELGGVRAAGFDFERVQVRAGGTARSHQLRLNVHGKQLSAALALDGTWNATAKRWAGTLSDVELAPADMPAWRQQQPSKLTWQNGAATLSRLCLSAGTPHLCLAGGRTAAGAVTANYDLAQLPLQMLAAFAPSANPLPVNGELSGSGQLVFSARGGINGNASLDAGAGSIAYASNPGRPLLAWSRLQANASLSGNGQRVRLAGDLDDGGSIRGDITVSGKQHALQGAVDVDVRSLAVLEALSPEIANVQGGLIGQLTLAGTLAAPQFTGAIRTHGFSAELPRAGLKLRDGQFALNGDAQGRLTLTGQVTSGQGVLHVGGSAGLAAGAPLNLAIKGNDVLVADTPAARVVASPDLHIARSQGVFAVTGSVTIPNAKVEVEKLPGQGPAEASPDVVIVDAPPAAEVAPLAMTANVEVKLGDAVKLQGYGLDGTLHGQLAVAVQPGRTATGRGEIRVAGKYQAYGQNLNIERGRLLFAGTRLDDPGLDIRAVRVIRSQDITVGLAVRGSAQRPVLTVFSDPALEQAEALSYLVTGRPLDSLKSGEGDTLNIAAQALGGLAGDRLAKSIGSRIGLEAGVASSEALGGSAFTAGKYLSPRLFLSYGVGLFTPGQVITLRYTLNRFLQFEAENATTGNRASLNYKIEK
jgi:translocation and assembly module TamB